MAESKTRSAWFWVPSLYFSQGIPYVVVMTMSVIMYKRLGVSNTEIALYTSWLNLPWVIKPFWSPLVDLTRTKRLWVVAMQFLVALALALVAFSVRGSNFFRWSLFLFWIMAFASATHDIAADGFYMLSLSPHQQAWWVGLRSTFYRTAMIVGSGLLVVLAGVLESKHGLPPMELRVSARANVAAETSWQPEAIHFAEQPGPLHLVAQPPALEIARRSCTAAEAAALIASAQQWNEVHGFLADTAAPPSEAKPGGALGPRPSLMQHLFCPVGAAWRKAFSQPLQAFLSAHFPKQAGGQISAAGNVGVIYFALSQPPPPGRRIVVNFAAQKTGLQFFGLANGGQGFSLRQGERLVFDAANWNYSAMAVVQLDPHLPADASAVFVTSAGDIPLAWSLTLFSVAALFLAFSCWHGLMLPRPAGDRPVITHASWSGEFLATLGSFFSKPGIIPALAFILLYRFDEAQLSKVISPFLLDSRGAGGLGLATSQVGLAYGTFGILALTGGGLLGGFAAARHGLKKMLPVMVAAMYLPKLIFLFLAVQQPDNFLVICGAVAVEQFGYGFGFTAFMLYLLYFADGPHKTAHYAMCTGFMALGMMIPGMWSGWLVDLVGYQHFFGWVLCSTLPGLFLAFQLKIDPQFGRRR
jgi:PAT family beta-lactamase induction signal transducer AmpG